MQNVSEKQKFNMKKMTFKPQTSLIVVVLRSILIMFMCYQMWITMDNVTLMFFSSLHHLSSIILLLQYIDVQKCTGIHTHWFNVNKISTIKGIKIIYWSYRTVVFSSSNQSEIAKSLHIAILCFDSFVCSNP